LNEHPIFEGPFISVVEESEKHKLFLPFYCTNLYTSVVDIHNKLLYFFLNN
jgi:hypothetical protein